MRLLPPNPTRARLLRLLLRYSLLLVLAVPALADHAGLVAAEQQIVAHEAVVTDLSKSLEEWLSGRMGQKAFLSKVDSLGQALHPYTGLAAGTGNAVLKLEQGLLEAARAFAKQESPTAAGQRQLFLSLGRLTEERTQKLLDWRSKEIGRMLKSERYSTRKAYYGWEASWIPLWREEARLTYQLQASVLSDKSEDKAGREVLSSFLKLTAKADQLKVPDTAVALQSLSKDRLTVLTRTSEQLLRLEKRQSRSAITQVRRLSAKLSTLTEQYQSARLKLLRTL